MRRSKNQVAESNFHNSFHPRHQKGRRIPINFQDKVNNKLKNSLDEKHNCPDKYFISSTLVTVKKDQTIKLALNLKIPNKVIHKNKYQMPNIDTLIESISQQISAPASQNSTYFSILDMKFNLILDPDTANHCNFNMISGDMTCTYPIQTGFYGLTDMPAELQKAMDYTLIRLKKAYCFLDDIFIASKESEEEYKQFVLNYLKRLEDGNLSINLLKCHFFKLEIDWLGYHISQSGISTIEIKTSVNLALEV